MQILFYGMIIFLWVAVLSFNVDFCSSSPAFPDPAVGYFWSKVLICIICIF